MNKRLYLLGFLCVAGLSALILSCDSANPVAPSGTVLTLTANPTQIGINGSSVITVTGFKPDGNPLNPGTQIILGTDLGVLDSTLVSADSTGRAATTLRGDGRPGDATVTASIPTGSAGGGGGDGGGTTNQVLVRVGENEDTKPKVSVFASPDTIGQGETTSILVRVRNADDSPFGSGGVVQLTTTLGTLADDEVVTDSNGEATTTLTAGNISGTATVTAFIGSSDTGGDGGTGSASVTIQTAEERRPTLIISANPSIVRVLGSSEITVIARDFNGNPVSSGQRIRLTADLGSVPSEAFTNSNGEVVVAFTAGDQAGTGSVSAILGNSDPAEVQITIRDAVAGVSFSANPLTIDRLSGDDMVVIRLTATVVNARGEPLSNILVTFESPDVGGTFQTVGGAQSSGTEQTGGDGVAEVDLTVTAAGVGPTRTSFRVRVTVVSEGQTFIQERTINVRN